MLPTYRRPRTKKLVITNDPVKAIKKQHEMIKIICPQCHKEPGYIYLNDGASHDCKHCKTVFHYCACHDAVKYGSPGPLMCEDCRSYESTFEKTEDIEKVHFKRYLFEKRLIRYD